MICYLVNNAYKDNNNADADNNKSYNTAYVCSGVHARTRLTLKTALDRALIIKLLVSSIVIFSRNENNIVRPIA